MHTLAVIELSFWAFILSNAVLLLGGLIGGVLLAFTLWLEDKWFLLTTVAGGLLPFCLGLCFLRIG